MKKKQKISIWVSNKSDQILLYHESTKELETEMDKFRCSRLMLKIFDVKWEKIGFM